MTMGGVMHYIEIDIANLKSWFARTGAHAAGTGNQAWNNNGYIVYFSDRRSNRNGANETGEYGYEDVVNPTTAAGTPDNVLQTGEDVQSATEVALGFGTLQVYGATPPSQPAGAGAPYTTAAGRPTTAVTLQAIVKWKSRPALAEGRVPPGSKGPAGWWRETGLVVDTIHAPRRAQGGAGSG